MRRDMPKVIVERPRGGRYRTFGERRSKFERASRDRTEQDVLPKMMPTRFDRTAWLNENLAPLRRFLRSRVGRPWDRVYAELRAHLAPRRAVDMHVLQHLEDYVCFARREGNEVWLMSRGGRRFERLKPKEPGLPYPRFLLYVCCDTGLLRERPPGRRKKPKKRKGNRRAPA